MVGRGRRDGVVVGRARRDGVVVCRGRRKLAVVSNAVRAIGIAMRHHAAITQLPHGCGRCHSRSRSRSRACPSVIGPTNLISEAALLDAKEAALPRRRPCCLRSALALCASGAVIFAVCIWRCAVLSLTRALTASCSIL